MGAEYNPVSVVYPFVRAADEGRRAINETHKEINGEQ
jgi:hypothetical protein